MMKVMEKDKKRIIYFILVLICMVTVFVFSSENGEESQNTSDSAFTDKIVKIIKNIFPSTNKQKIFGKANLIVRKGAHFSLFFIIGIFIFAFINTYPTKIKNKIVITIILGTLYAISDEIHQLFVPERTGQIKDVFIDMSGVALGTLTGCLIKLKRGEKIGRVRHKKNSTNDME